MQKKLLIGVAGGLVALAIGTGIVLSNAPVAAQTNTATAQATATAQPGTPQPEHNRKAHRLLAGSLIKATADVTGVSLRDIMQDLRDGKSLAQIAQEHGKTADEVIQAARTKVQERLNQAVANGRLDQARADELLAGFDQQAPQLMSDTNLARQIGHAIKARHPVAHGLIRATAEVTGLTAQDVITELRNGKSLAQIAQEHGKTADDILAKLREQGEQRLQQALDRAQELINRPGLQDDQEPAPSPTTAATQ